MTENKYRSIFVSDVHLGSKHSNAELLMDFYKKNDADNYFLVGDIIDGWILKKKHHWPQAHNDMIQHLLKKSKKGAKVFYITGNHDEFMRDYTGLKLGNIRIEDEIIYSAANGNQYLIIHGDQFDFVTMNAKWLAHFGGWAYDIMISLNTKFTHMFRMLNLEVWSVSAWVKQNVKEAVNFICDYENAISDYAHKYGVSGVVCGHIHHAEDKEIVTYGDGRTLGRIHYLNCGDMVESCTLIVEHHNGKFEIVRLSK